MTTEQKMAMLRKAEQNLAQKGDSEAQEALRVDQQAEKNKQELQIQAIAWALEHNIISSHEAYDEKKKEMALTMYLYWMNQNK